MMYNLRERENRFTTKSIQAILKMNSVVLKYSAEAQRAYYVYVTAEIFED